MKPTDLRYRDLIPVLILEIKTFCDLFEQDEHYRALLREIKKYDINRDGLPYQKNLLNALGMSRAALMDLMHALYEEFQRELCSPNAYPITGREVWILAKTREDYWVIGIDDLELIPSKGDQISMEFVRGRDISGRYFTVKRIHHELEVGIHKINIHLEEGFSH